MPGIRAWGDDLRNVRSNQHGCGLHVKAQAQASAPRIFRVDQGVQHVCKFCVCLDMCTATMNLHSTNFACGFIVLEFIFIREICNLMRIYCLGIYLIFASVVISAGHWRNSGQNEQPLLVASMPQRIATADDIY